MMLLYLKGNGCMKNHLLVLLIFALTGVVIWGLWAENASAKISDQFQGIEPFTSGQQAVATLIPTDTPPVAEVETPEPRLLPPVGSNAGLIIGACVLVLIILGGVLGTQRRRNH